MGTLTKSPLLKREDRGEGVRRRWGNNSRDIQAGVKAGGGGQRSGNKG